MFANIPIKTFTYSVNKDIYDACWKMLAWRLLVILLFIVCLSDIASLLNKRRQQALMKRFANKC